MKQAEGCPKLEPYLNLPFSYVLVEGEKVFDRFEAASDEDAEKYVEENYSPNDGSMTLYKTIVSWP